jgi:PAS domain S-box-containing protein
MNKKKIAFKLGRYNYALFGVVFGACFPIISYFLLEKPDILYLIICTAPVFLGFFSFYAGLKQDEKIEKAVELEKSKITAGELLLSELNKVRLEQESIELDMTLLVDTANAPIFGIDVNGHINEWNKRSEQITGFTKVEVLGQDLVENFITDDYKVPVREVLNKALEGEETANYEFPLYSKSGERVDVLLNSTTRRDATGKIVGVVGVGQDITHLKQTEELLRRTQKMESIGELTGGIAHDFNNLLGIIIGNHDLMKRNIKNGNTLRLLEQINSAQKAALRGAEVTRRLLNFSRQSEEAHSPVNIDKIISEFEDFIRKSITASINLEIDIAEDIWMIDLNPGDFQDALINLSLNARDAMPSGGRLIFKVSNAIIDHDMTDYDNNIKAGDYVQISVSDAGTGMAKETVDKIFEPFFTTKDKNTGTGLGLPMVFSFVKRCSGGIKVYSEEGLGTTFTLYLPRSQSGAEQVIQSTDIDKTLPRGKETVLIVDDEEELRTIAVSVLEELGYTTLCASSADEALEILSKVVNIDDIDIVFIDVVMPGNLNAFDLAEAMSKLKPDIKILLTSGFAGKISKKKSHEKWALNLLTKPYRDVELAESIRKRLDE